MPREFSNDIERHVLGATVTHAGPFSSIEVPELAEPLSREFVQKWVVPFYRASLFHGGDKFAESLRPIASEITPELLTQLLSDFNWRPRITAAYFAAVLIEDSVVEHIGKLLLRSDVCFAGNGYCLALARFNRKESVEYLSQYLEYYLTKPDLHFDQEQAIGALAHLDSLNGTTRLEDFSELWDQFISVREYGSLESAISRFQQQMAAIMKIAEGIKDNN